MRLRIIMRDMTQMKMIREQHFKLTQTEFAKEGRLKHAETLGVTRQGKTLACGPPNTCVAMLSFPVLS